LGYHHFVSNGYSWRDIRGEETYRLPGPEHLGWWAAAAMLVSILLHVMVFFALDRMKIALRFNEAREMSTRPVDVRQVEIRPMDEEERQAPENLVEPPVDAASLLEEVDLLDMLPKEQEIDIKPEILQAEYALKMENPALAGDPEAIALEAASALEVDADLPDPGREPSAMTPAEVGQVTVDPGSVMADELDLGKFTDDLIKQGAGGKVEKGALDGITSLDDLIGLPPNTLVGKATMLPSDLLFEFNSAELRESAKVGLMKLGLLIDRNPTLYCWIEGHTDLIGGDDFNLELSRRRAAAVKNYLVESMRMDGEKIITRGFGRSRPLVAGGTADEQMPNRRVEIRMRRTPPPDEPVRVTPRVEPPPVVEPPRAVLVKPQRALPVEEDEPVVAPPAPPRAVPVEEEAPRAVPVEPGIPRARAVDE
jgi:OmpA-OmpF porin, OOP family